MAETVRSIDPPRLGSVPAACKAYGIPRPTMYRLIQRGELPVVRQGRAIWIRLDGLERWIEANTVGGQDLLAA